MANALRNSSILALSLVLAACDGSGFGVTPTPVLDPTPSPFGGGSPPEVDPDLPLIDDSGLVGLGHTELAPLDVLPEVPFAGDSVTITVTVPGGEIDLDLEGPACGSLMPATGSSPLVLTGSAGASGWCDVSATAWLSDGSSRALKGRFSVQEEDPRVAPLDIPGAIWVNEALPEPSSDPDAPRIVEVGGPQSFVNGSTTSHPIALESVDGISTMAVAMDDFPGYWLIPVDPEETDVRLNLGFPTDFFEQLGGARSVVTIWLMLDPADRPSALVAVPLSGIPAGTGSVQVSVTWDNSADVDLHVIEPGGDIIYWNDPASAAGGVLDLDSNESCVLDGTQVENIVYSNGAPQGEFVAKVRMYADCGAPGASGVVTVTNCNGDTSSFPFVLDGSGDELEFSFESECTVYGVSGRVRYEDFTVRRTGLNNNSRMLSAPYLRVQAIREADGALLGETDANRSGRYSIRFTNDQADVNPRYYVHAIAWQDNDRAKQEVVDLSGRIHGWASEILDHSATALATGIDLDVKMAEGAEALNIFAVGLQTRSYARRSRRSLPFVQWVWEAGANSPQCASCYQNDTIWVAGASPDPDGYDDVVLAHEFGHFVLDNTSQDDSVGGFHSGAPADPKLAWSEGWATFFGCAATGQSAYIDAQSASPFHISIETLPSGITLGNGGSLGGDLSEFVVAGVLWDLKDGRTETMDTIGGGERAAWKITTTYMQAGSPSFADRGEIGRDLVDFLDGWICQDYGQLGANDTEGLRGNVRGIHQLTYDFPTLTSCP
jgi:hypothetical protein